MLLLESIKPPDLISPELACFGLLGQAQIIRGMGLPRCFQLAVAGEALQAIVTDGL